MSEILSQQIGELGFSEKVLGCLTKAGLQTVSDLVQQTETAIVILDGADRHVLKEIVGKLKEHGLSLGTKL